MYLSHEFSCLEVGVGNREGEDLVPDGVQGFLTDLGRLGYCVFVSSIETQLEIKAEVYRQR